MSEQKGDGEMEIMVDTARVAKLERTRIAYKGSITKRLKQLTELVAAGGSRTKIRFLQEAMLKVFGHQKDTCKQLYGEDDTLIIEEQARIDVVLGEINDYLESRKEEESSRSSRISNWVKEHRVPVTEEEEPIYDTVGKMDVNTSENPESMAMLQKQKFPRIEMRAYAGGNTSEQCLANEMSRKGHVLNTEVNQFQPRTMVNGDVNRFCLQRQNEMLRQDDQLKPTTLANDSGHLHHEVGGDNLFLNTFSGPGRRRTLPELPGVGIARAVDAWIDDLREACDETVGGLEQSEQAIMALLTQQTLPRLSIPKFDGRADKWLNFIRKFHDLVHKEPYMSGIRKCALLFQFLEGEAHRAVAGVPCDWEGYVISLKRIKFLFGETSKVVTSVIRKITTGPSIKSDSRGQLAQFLYDVSDCVISLRQLASPADLHSHEILCMTVRRMPKSMQMKWAANVSRMRARQEKPNLVKFEDWLRERVITLREASNYKDDEHAEQSKTKPDFNGFVSQNERACKVCNAGTHPLSKCDVYQGLNSKEKYSRVTSLGACFCCLGKSHKISDCPSKGKCLVDGCGRRHHTSLHEYYAKINPKKQGIFEGKKNAASEKTESESTSQFNGVLEERGTEIYLQIVPVILKGANGNEVHTHALLDTGSQVSLVRKDISEKLGLRGKHRYISVGTIKDEPEKVAVREVKLFVMSRSGNMKIEIANAYSVPRASFKMPSRSSFSGSLEGLEEMKFASIRGDQVGILIGANVPEAMIVKEVKRGRSDQPLAVKTVFGWTLFGAENPGHEKDVTVSLLHTHKNVVTPLGEGMPSREKRAELITKRNESEQAVDIGVASKDKTGKLVTENTESGLDLDLNKQLERFWKQESTGFIKSDRGMSIEDAEALSVLKKETKFVSEKYQVPMLWNRAVWDLPDSISMARKRFKSLIHKLRAKPELYDSFKKVIDDYVVKGHARRMTPEEELVRTAKTWYLPIFAVFNKNKPDKVRIVNDAAAVHAGFSLNSSLITGPDLLNSLVGVLLNFRVGRIAIVSDIQAMFHQVRVSPKDADSLRFFWTDDINSDNDYYSMQMLVHIFGAKDSSTCAIYALLRTAQDNSAKFSPETIRTVMKNFYVDDLLKSVMSVNEAKELVQQLTELLNLGGFRLTKWVSNSREVLESVPQSERAKNVLVNLDNNQEERALGISWDVTIDSFSFKFDLPEMLMTKRGILKVTSSVFDPLGFVTPFVLKAKMILQALWKERVDWDEPIREDIQKVWKNWVMNAKDLSDIKLDRCYTGLNEQKAVRVELHVFCDASNLAFGSIAYLRFCYADGTFRTSFVMAKSNLAPIRTMSLPRLELCSAVTAVRLCKVVMSDIELKIDKVYFWTDSTLNLQYISNEKFRFKTFVANRISEILENTTRNQWSHIPGILNPGDILTRGVASPGNLLKENKRGTSWFHGPKFLTTNVGWPGQELVLRNEPLDSNPEVNSKKILLTLEAYPENDNLILFDRFSKWNRLQRAIAWALRFISNVRKRNRRSGQVSCIEIENSRNLIVKKVQGDVFRKEIEALTHNSEIKSVLTPLTPFIDEDEIMRVGGRLRRVEARHGVRHPIILPKDHKVTDLIITHVHAKIGHIGVEHTLAELRQEFWVVHGRSAVKRVIRRCFFCRMRRAKHMYPLMADLPAGRLAVDQPPFAHSGVDLFGPMYIKEGRKRLKRWVALFTCLTVRCVHLEVVENADTDAFINALRRFVNRRGCPEVLHSDRGSNFVGASNELKEFRAKIDSKRVEDFCANVKIKWEFNPPLAPHMGGIWERMVRSTKGVLSGLMADKVVTDAQLYTLLTEVESILNSRPLTHVSDNPSDFEALTPNHILLGMHKRWACVASVGEKEVSSRRKWRQVQALARMFWERWRREYLPEKTKRHKWHNQVVQKIVPGELILIDDDAVKKRAWSLGRVVQLMPSDDGEVRVVQVRTKDGVYTRPVAKLRRLEGNLVTSVGAGTVKDRISDAKFERRV